MRGMGRLTQFLIRGYFRELRLQMLGSDDILTGEYGLNAAVAGHFSVPVILVSGDRTACSQVAGTARRRRGSYSQTGLRKICNGRCLSQE